MVLPFLVGCCKVLENCAEQPAQAASRLDKTPPPHLDQEEGHPVRPEGAAELNVAELGVELAEVVQLAVLGKDEPLHALELGVLPRQHLLQGQKAGLVLGLVVVPVLDLALQGRKLYAFLTGAGVGPVYDGVAGLGKGERDGRMPICL